MPGTIEQIIADAARRAAFEQHDTVQLSKGVALKHIFGDLNKEEVWALFHQIVEENRKPTIAQGPVISTNATLWELLVDQVKQVLLDEWMKGQRQLSPASVSPANKPTRARLSPWS